jgi:hypothetical protein
MSTTDRAGGVRVPALTSPSLVRWWTATAVGLVAVTVWAVVTQPPSVWGPGVPFMVALLATLTAIVWVSRRVDADGGVVTQVRARVLRRRVPLGPGTEVVLVPNGGGSVVLALRGPGERRRLHLPLLTTDVYGDRMQSAAVFRALADTVERHGGAGGRQVVTALRAQARAADDGVPVRQTPLGGLATDGVLRVARAGGAAGAGGSARTGG